MRAAFGMPHAPVLIVNDLRFGPLGVTELRFDALDYGRSAAVRPQDALMLSLQMRQSARHEIWEDGKRVPQGCLQAGVTSIYDLRRDLTARSVEPFHSLNFNLPLDPIGAADDVSLAGLQIARDMRTLNDPVIRALGLSLLPSLAEPRQAVRLFVDHVLFALRSHVVKRFGRREPRAPRPGGLAPWQERRAKELIGSCLATDVSLAELAQECGLSVAQFARAFKRSTGVPPYRYLLERRLEHARTLLLLSDLPLADVAVCCGFADQSHFTKAFQKRVGSSPGAFRAAGRSTRLLRR